MSRNYKRVSGGYNPGAWAYKKRSKKNDGCLGVIILVITTFSSLFLIF